MTRNFSRPLFSAKVIAVWSRVGPQFGETQRVAYAVTCVGSRICGPLGGRNEVPAAWDADAKNGRHGSRMRIWSRLSCREAERRKSVHELLRSHPRMTKFQLIGNLGRVQRHYAGGDACRRAEVFATSSR